MDTGKWEETRTVALKLERIRVRDPNGYRELERRIGGLLGEPPAAPSDRQTEKRSDPRLHRY